MNEESEWLRFGDSRKMERESEWGWRKDKKRLKKQRKPRQSKDTAINKYS